MRIRSCTSLLVFGLLLSPVLARAAPATIRIFEAEVHAEPDLSSPVIYTFPENARVSVSEDAVNGFRKVRLPDGKVGYIEERALAIAGPRAAPSRPPPPPPTFEPPPPPPPPPPGPPGPPGYYRPIRYFDPTAFRHLGFFLRFDLGLGYLGTSKSTLAAPTFLNFDAAHGVAGEFGFALGGALVENLILAGHVWGTSAFSPTISLRGVGVPTGGDFSTSLFGVGPSLDYYFMPQNVFVTITPSLTWVRFSDAFTSFDSNVGFGTRLALGKEWWASPHFGIGLAGWFAFSFNKEQSGGPTWNTYAGGLTFTGSFNF